VLFHNEFQFRIHSSSYLILYLSLKNIFFLVLGNVSLIKIVKLKCEEVVLRVWIVCVNVFLSNFC